ncbi:MAG: hypothetical protein HOW73_47580 [Polyangiaceae bacterium]|nr:hypothetical protein [Polyangiaceae bacterium]
MITLDGIDPAAPEPYVAMQIALNRGASGGLPRARDCVILCNKLASVGDASLDGNGEAINVPRRILEGETEVISRAGFNSEALLLFKTGIRANPFLQFWLQIVGPGSVAATADWTFATNADRAGTVIIECVGEAQYVGVLKDDTPTIVAGLVKDKIKEQSHWPITASALAGVLTTVSTTAGSRFTHYINMLRIRFVKTNAMTITKGSVTAGSTDDDQTTAIANLEQHPIYYQVNPKQVTTAVNPSDNGIGEHIAAMQLWTGASIGTNCMLCVGNVGTPLQATAVAASINQPFCNIWHAEDSDWSAGMIAVHLASIKAYKESAYKAANLADYGRKDSTDTLFVPDPFDKADRATKAEIRLMLNNGVSPIAFDTNGKPYLVRDITTKHLTNGNFDYRARSGHIWSVACDLRESLLQNYRSEAQDNIMDDPVEGQKPLPGFTTPRDVKGIVHSTIDQKIFRERATLDPSSQQAMKDSFAITRTPAGFNARFKFAAVRHLYQAGFLAEEVSPAY